MMNRDVLPIEVEQERVAAPKLDVRDHGEPFTVAAPIRPPENAPNILTIVLDDVGFGASSAFGGPCNMPTAERLARGGLRYNRFHTTGLCSPTRQALMTGRNPHSVGMGGIPEMSTNVPGYNAQRPDSSATIARILGLNGYTTGAFGKMHQTPAPDISPNGPFKRWPLGDGFDVFYGFLGPEADHFNPSDLIRGNAQVDPPRGADEGYHLSEDIVEQAMSWISTHSNLMPGQPWYCHLSFGACHAPIHVPEAWRDRYAGAFNHGWDEERIRIFERQKKLGVVPLDATLPPWPSSVPAWSSLSAAERERSARLMELFAAFAEHADFHVGRLIDLLEQSGALENTLIFYLLGDNGAASVGGPTGTFNELLRINGFSDHPADTKTALNELGGPNSFPQIPTAWGLTLDTPYQWTKQVASHYGGTRNGLVVHWPRVIQDGGSFRSHWHHVIDFAPTALEAAGLPTPSVVDGVRQDPMHGVSFLYSMKNASADEQRTTQYFECVGNRGIYHNGWTAVTKHRTPWKVDPAETSTFAEDIWELYDTRSDWTQAKDVSDKYPELLADLKSKFMHEAVKYGVLPLDDRFHERFNPLLAGRRAPLEGNGRFMFPPNMPRLRENIAPNLKNTSHTITAEIDFKQGDEGVLAAQGSRFGGWSLFIADGRPVYCYNMCGIDKVYLRAPQKLATGATKISIAFKYDGGGVGKGADLALMINGEVVETGRLERSVPYLFSMEATFDVGVDRGATVSDEYAGDRQNRFTGSLHQIVIEVGDDYCEPSFARTLTAAIEGH